MDAENNKTMNNTKNKKLQKTEFECLL